MQLKSKYYPDLVLAEKGIMAMITPFLKDQDYVLHLYQRTEIELAKAANRGEPVIEVGPWCRQFAVTQIPRYWSAESNNLTEDQDLLWMVYRAFLEQCDQERKWQMREKNFTHTLFESGAADDTILQSRYQKRRGIFDLASECQSDALDIVEYLAQKHLSLLDPLVEYDVQSLIQLFVAWDDNLLDQDGMLDLKQTLQAPTNRLVMIDFLRCTEAMRNWFDDYCDESDTLTENSASVINLSTLAPAS
jgi:hypothetical protein